MSIILAALSIVPLLWISFYDHPSADDYDYAFRTYAAWKSGRSLGLVLKEAVLTSAEFWHKWQGLYTSAFLLALEPAIFGEQYYCITGFLTIGTLVCANLLFFVYVLRKRLRCHTLTAVSCGMLSSVLMLHWMPSPVEGLYWYNGAMNYTFFFGVMILLFCLVLELMQEIGGWRLYIRVFAGCITAFALSGGNHVTAFAGLLLTFGILAGCVFWRKKSYALRVLIVWSVEAAGFLLNISSPGTRVRASAFAKPQGVFWTVRNALVFLFEQLDRWIGLALIAALVLMLPFFWKEAKAVYERTGFRFRAPLAVAAASAGLAGAMLCPSFYAMGAAGAGRLVNVIYFTFVLLVFVNLFYLCGYLAIRLENVEFFRTSGWILTMALFFAGAFLGCTGSSAGMSAWKSVTSGEAALYSQEADARYNLYIRSQGKDVIVKPFSVCPQLLFFDDITEDITDWRNGNVTEYYGLNSVRLSDE